MEQYAECHGVMLQEKGKSRSDFTTEEDWQKYKSNKEAMPKAAFQFGVKMTEGRKVTSGPGQGQGRQAEHPAEQDPGHHGEEGV